MMLISIVMFYLPIFDCKHVKTTEKPLLTPPITIETRIPMLTIRNIYPIVLFFFIVTQ